MARLSKAARRERAIALYATLRGLDADLERARRFARSLQMRYAEEEIEAARFRLESMVRTCGRAGQWDEVVDEATRRTFGKRRLDAPPPPPPRCEGPSVRVRCNRCRSRFTKRPGHLIQHNRRQGAVTRPCDGELLAMPLEPVKYPVRS